MIFLVAGWRLRYGTGTYVIRIVAVNGLMWQYYWAIGRVRLGKWSNLPLVIELTVRGRVDLSSWFVVD